MHADRLTSVVNTNIINTYVAQTLKDAGKLEWLNFDSRVDKRDSVPGFFDDEGNPKNSELVTWKTTAQAAST